jgi:hypothetical protein
MLLFMKPKYRSRTVIRNTLFAVIRNTLFVARSCTHLHDGELLLQLRHPVPRLGALALRCTPPVTTAGPARRAISGPPVVRRACRADDSRARPAAPACHGPARVTHERVAATSRQASHVSRPRDTLVRHQPHTNASSAH